MTENYYAQFIPDVITKQVFENGKILDKQIQDIVSEDIIQSIKDQQKRIYKRIKKEV